MLHSDPGIRRRAEQEDPGSTRRRSPQLLREFPVQGSLNGLIGAINAATRRGPIWRLARLRPLDQHQPAIIVD
jgi:hypothetical protein